MPDRAYTFRMPAGIPGECTRLAVLGTTITPEKVNTAAVIAGGAAWGYGQLAIVESGGSRPATAADAAFNAGTWGVLVRPFPTGDLGVAFPAGIVDFGAGTPPSTGVLNIMRRGFVSVKVNGGVAAAKGGAVYAFTGATAAPHQQGGFEAAAGTGAVQVPGAYWQGPADAQGNAEIGWNI